MENASEGDSLMTATDLSLCLRRGERVEDQTLVT